MRQGALVFWQKEALFSMLDAFTVYPQETNAPAASSSLPPQVGGLQFATLLYSGYILSQESLPVCRL